MVSCRVRGWRCATVAVVLAGAGDYGHHAAATVLGGVGANDLSQATVADRESIPFFVLGDFGGGPQSMQSGDMNWKLQVANRMGEWAAALRPWFVVGLGDNFYDDGVETAQDPAWEVQFEAVYSSQHLLDVPWLMCLGNHDYYMARPEAQMERTGNDTHGRWYMPSRSYSRRFSRDTVSVEVFSVDTNAISYTLTPETAGSCEFAEPVPGCSPIFEKEAARVLEDLETRLKASTATWKVVAGHHPMYSAGHHGCPRETAPLRSALLPLFDRYGVDLYACGHDHIAQHISPNASPQPLTEKRGWQQTYGDEKPSSAASPNDTSVSIAEGSRNKRSSAHGEDGADAGSVRGSGGDGSNWEVGKVAKPGDDTVGRPQQRHDGRVSSLPSRGENDGREFEVRRTEQQSTTDHVTIGTSGPKIMSGKYNFEFEQGQRQELAINSASRDADFGGDADDRLGGMGGAHNDAEENYRGYQLLYVTKRRAFGVVEASENVLRVTFVGADGGVLYSFDRTR